MPETRTARIFRPARTATQSGRAGTRLWRLSFEPRAARRVEPLMGWTASADMDQQVRLTFETREAAVEFAERNGIAYVVDDPQPRRSPPKAYADNFRHDRVTARQTGPAGPPSDSAPREPGEG